MKYDIIVTGVGGQGVLGVASAIAASALRAGLHVKQSEEHGMAQRGGSVVTHLRLADGPVHSDLVPQGRADLILGMEPLESLRHLGYLSPEGRVLTAADPVENFPGYPDPARTLRALRALPRAHAIDAAGLSRAAGSERAVNMVMLGAASTLLPIDREIIEAHIREAFAGKGSKVVETNIAAFRAGREVMACSAA